MSDKNLDQTFLSGSNSVFINDLLNKWENDPKSVPEEWSNLFKEIGSEIADKGPSWAKENNRVIGAVDVEESVKAVAQGVAGKGKISASDLRSATTDSLRAIMLIRAYRIRGHLLANLDPLKLYEPDIHPELDPKTYGFKEEDWDRPIFIDNVLGMETASLKQIMDILKKRIVALLVSNLCMFKIQRKKHGSKKELNLLEILHSSQIMVKKQFSNV